MALNSNYLQVDSFLCSGTTKITIEKKKKIQDWRLWKQLHNHFPLEDPRMEPSKAALATWLHSGHEKSDMQGLLPAQLCQKWCYYSSLHQLSWLRKKHQNQGIDPVQYGKLLGKKIWDYNPITLFFWGKVSSLPVRFLTEWKNPVYPNS